MNMQIGCDRCAALCGIARAKDCEVLRADGLCLPWREATADAVICIAVLHHLSTAERRERLLRELLRVLRPGGRACITVWAMEQRDSEYGKMREKKEKREKQSNSSRLLVHDSREFVQQDLLVPWTDGDATRLRFYHVFEEGELDAVVKALPGCSLVSSVHEQGNWIVVMSKNP